MEESEFMKTIRKKSSWTQESLEENMEEVISGPKFWQLEMTLLQQTVITMGADPPVAFSSLHSENVLLLTDSCLHMHTDFHCFLQCTDKWFENGWMKITDGSKLGFYFWTSPIPGGEWRIIFLGCGRTSRRKQYKVIFFLYLVSMAKSHFQ